MSESMQAALEAGRRKDYVTVIKCLTECNLDDPNNPRVHYLMGFAYYQMGRKEDAILHLLKCLSLDPEHQQAKSLLHSMNPLPPMAQSLLRTADLPKAPSDDKDEKNKKEPSKFTKYATAFGFSLLVYAMIGGFGGGGEPSKPTTSNGPAKVETIPLTPEEIQGREALAKDQEKVIQQMRTEGWIDRIYTPSDDPNGMTRVVEVTDTFMRQPFEVQEDAMRIIYQYEFLRDKRHQIGSGHRITMVKIDRISGVKLIGDMKFDDIQDGLRFYSKWLQ